MKRILAGLSVIAMLLAAGSALAVQRTVTLAVDNMTCELCPTTVKKSLAKVAGVSQVAVSFEKKTATVTYDDGETTLAALTAATTQAGYPSRAVP